MCFNTEQSACSLVRRLRPMDISNCHLCLCSFFLSMYLNERAYLYNCGIFIADMAMPSSAERKDDLKAVNLVEASATEA